jgi:hypothetical protein
MNVGGRAGDRATRGIVAGASGVSRGHTVHQVVRQWCYQTPQRPWSTRGAHLLRQPRVKMLNGAGGAVGKRWSPERQLAEAPPGGMLPSVSMRSQRTRGAVGAPRQALDKEDAHR